MTSAPRRQTLGGLIDGALMDSILLYLDISLQLALERKQGHSINSNLIYIFN